KGQRYLLYPGQFVVQGGGERTVLRWDQIREVFHVFHPAWRQFQIVSYKTTLTITGETKDHCALGEAIAREVAGRLLPDAWRRLEQGESLSFGPIRMSRAGLECHHQSIPWHQIATFTFGLNLNACKGGRSSKMIHLRLTPACQVALNEVPNYRLF